MIEVLKNVSQFKYRKNGEKKVHHGYALELQNFELLPDESS